MYLVQITQHGPTVINGYFANDGLTIRMGPFYSRFWQPIFWKVRRYPVELAEIIAGIIKRGFVEVNTEIPCFVDGISFNFRQGNGDMIDCDVNQTPKLAYTFHLRLSELDKWLRLYSCFTDELAEGLPGTYALSWKKPAT